MLLKQEQIENLSDEALLKLYERNEKIIQQKVWNDFMQYAIHDIRVMLDIEEKAKLFSTAKLISYLCGVNITEVSGTLKQWLSYMYNQAYFDGKILPLTQKKIKDEDDVVYKAGFTYANPGIYRYVISVDFASLYPNIFVSTNIGADTIIPEEELPQDLLKIREKYCDFYTNTNFYDISQGKRESDEDWSNRIKGKKDGLLTKKYNGDTNNIDEEKQWIFNINEIDDFSNILKKYNVTMTPDGYFYHHKYQSEIGKAMKINIARRYEAKYKAIELAGKIEKLKQEGKHVPEKLIDEMKYQDSLSLALKIFINSAYGSMPLKANNFSNGKLTAANLTITGRLLIHSVAQALNNELQKYLKEEKTWNFTHIAQMDTDSIYLCLDEIIKKYLPEAWENNDDEKIMQFILKLFNSKLNPLIKKSLEDVTNRFNFYDPEVLKMDQEIISNSFISLIKKRYFTRILYSDGNKLSEPKIKMVGISLVSRSTPKDIKKILKPTLEYFLNNDKTGLEEYLKSHYDDFKNIDIDGLGIPKTVTSIEYEPFFGKRKVQNWKIADKFCKEVKDTKKSEEMGFEVKKLLTAPENSIGSIVHNELVKENKLEFRYEYINNHDKIKIIHLVSPNPITNNFKVISYKDSKVLEDVGVKEFIDYEKFWEKEVLDKIDIIAEKIDWKINIIQNSDIDVW